MLKVTDNEPPVEGGNEDSNKYLGIYMESLKSDEEKKEFIKKYNKLTQEQKDMFLKNLEKQFRTEAPDENADYNLGMN